MADTMVSQLPELSGLDAIDYLVALDKSDTSQGAGGTFKRVAPENSLGRRGPLMVAANDSTRPVGANYVCDGTDDQVQIQSAIDAVNTAGGGEVLLLEGTYSIATPGVEIKPNVVLRGQGWGTILQGTGSTAFSIIDYDAVTYSGSNQLNDVQIRDLKIDGSNMTQPGSYSTAAKGIFCKGCLRWLIDNVWVTGTLATGIGVDHLTDSVIRGCLVDSCGRGLDDPNTKYGGNGIGIGTGQTTTESLLISDCTARGNGNNGIMFENQSGTPTGNKAYHLVNCHSEGNSGRGYRFAGVANLAMHNCTAYGNSKQGVILTGGLNGSNVVNKNIIISGCVINANTLEGVLIPSADSGDEPDNYYTEDLIIQGCIIRDNTDGLELGSSATQTSARLQILNNLIMSNSGYGVRLDGTLDRVTIANNRIFSNTTGTIIDGSTSTNLVIRDNEGYNPVGASTVSTAGWSSPQVYTAGSTPERLYLDGGTVSDVAKDSVTIASSSPAVIDLGPGESVTITYSSVPTVVKDQR